MPWVVDDVCGCGGQKVVVGNTGELRNPNFPAEVAVDEEWTGTIDAYNAGTETDTFRVRIDGEVGESFALGAGATKTISESGAGPKDFWIYLDRWVGVEGWLEWIKRHKIVLGVASAWGVGMVAVAAWVR